MDILKGLTKNREPQLVHTDEGYWICRLYKKYENKVVMAGLHFLT